MSSVKQSPTREQQLASIPDELMAKRRKAAGDVTRQRVMRLLSEDEEWTAKELADALDVSVNGLYYHLRVLEAAELIAPGGGRQGPSGLERTYRAGETWLVTHELNEDLILTYHAILENAKYEAAQATYRQIALNEKGKALPHVAVRCPGFQTTHEEIVEFDARLWDLIAEFRSRGEQLCAMPEDTEAPLVEFFLAYALLERTQHARTS